MPVSRCTDSLLNVVRGWRARGAVHGTTFTRNLRSAINEPSLVTDLTRPTIADKFEPPLRVAQIDAHTGPLGHRERHRFGEFARPALQRERIHGQAIEVPVSGAGRPHRSRMKSFGSAFNNLSSRSSMALRVRRRDFFRRELPFQTEPSAILQRQRVGTACRTPRLVAC
jgi:hypothetical protein